MVTELRCKDDDCCGIEEKDGYALPPLSAANKIAGKQTNHSQKANNFFKYIRLFKRKFLTVQRLL